VEVTYQLTADDFRRAISAHRTSSPFRRWSFRVGLSFVSFVLVTGVVLLIVAPHSNAFRNLLPLYALFILWVAMLWVSPILSARSQFRGSPSARGPITLEVTGAGLHFRSPFTDSRTDWSAYVKWVEEKAIFALFPNPKVFIVIPKRAFTLDQLGEFRELVRQRVKPQQ